MDEKIPSILMGDEEKIISVVNNLCSNAIKFTESGFVHLDILQGNENESTVYLRFTIKDSGIGIREDMKSKLFSNFAQGDDSYTKKYRGTGLGLALAKKFVEMMNGSIGFESTYQEGSTFTFEIPLYKEDLL